MWVRQVNPGQESNSHEWPNYAAYILRDAGHKLLEHSDSSSTVDRMAFTTTILGPGDNVMMSPHANN